MWRAKIQQTTYSEVLPCKWFFIHPWLHLLICDHLGYLWKYMCCFIVAKALPLPRHCWCQALRKVHKNCQTLSVNSDPLDLFVESLLLDMFSMGIPLLRGGVRVLIFHKVSFEKHSSAHTAVWYWITLTMLWNMKKKKVWYLADLILIFRSYTNVKIPQVSR